MKERNPSESSEKPFRRKWVVVRFLQRLPRSIRIEAQRLYPGVLLPSREEIVIFLKKLTENLY